MILLFSMLVLSSSIVTTLRLSGLVSLGLLLMVRLLRLLHLVLILCGKLPSILVEVMLMRSKQARIPNIASIHTYAGSPVHKILEPRFDGTVTRLVVTGEENIQDRMEAEAPLTDINYMLHRLSLGDQSVLSSRRPMYGDFTGLPSDPIEALNLVHQSEYAFSLLSAEEKRKYNNDWKQWFADLLSNKNVSRETLVPDDPQPVLEKKGVDSGVSESTSSVG